MEGSLRILLVEDDVDQANLMGEMLRRFNSDFLVETTYSSDGCLDKLSRQKYEAIILDYNLPERNALEILTTICNGELRTPVVVVSGSGSEQIAVETLKCGASDYLVKDDSFLTVLPKVVQKSIERARLEARLRESERKYQIIFEKANDAILILDATNFQIIEANSKTHEITGYAAEALVNKPLTELFPAFLYALVREGLSKAVSEGLYRDDDLTIVTNYGESIPIDLDARVIQFGRSDYILCNVRNIAEKKYLQTQILNSKRRLQNTFDGITDIIFQVNQADELVIVNKKFAELCNAQPEELIGKKYFAVFFKTGQPIDGCPIQKAFKTGESHWLEHTMDDQIYEIWTYPIFSVDGKLESVAAHSKNVTEKKKLEKTLIQSEKLATIGLLASGIAHELRNPLNVIETARYYIDEFLVEKNSDIRAKLDIIHKNVRRSSKIINNLLEFSRHSEHERERIDLRSLIESTISLIQKELQAKNIEFVLVCPGNYTTFFSIDSLKQVLLNLIINAIQAMQTGGKLTIAIEQSRPGWTDLKISDTGMGIPVKNLPHIFSPFFTTKEVGEGTGLGLYITHMIIAREGGRIKVDSEVNVGTTFTISLPQRDS
ncbi:MAG: ATP-binding protein [bacterium]